MNELDHESRTPIGFRDPQVAIRTTEGSSPTATLFLARASYESGDLKQACQLIDSILDESSGRGSALPSTLEQRQLHELRGFVFHDWGRPIQGADSFERASLIGPISDAARVALASCYRQLRRIDLARDLYLQLVLSRRLSSELSLVVAAGLDALGSSDLAMEVCDRVIEADPDSAQAYYDMAYYASRRSLPLHLIESLISQAVQIDPRNTTFRIGLVCHLVRAGHDVTALNLVEQLDLESPEIERCGPCVGEIIALLRRSGDEVRATEFEAYFRGRPSPGVFVAPINGIDVSRNEGRLA